jgi:hypothetical protein
VLPRLRKPLFLAILGQEVPLIEGRRRPVFLHRRLPLPP